MDEGLIIEGWAVIYDTPDFVGDVIKKGAFDNLLRSSNLDPQDIPLLFRHREDEPLGRIISLTELDEGLWVEAVIDCVDALSRDVASFVRSKKIGGLSIGFRPLKTNNLPKGSKRIIYGIELVEISVVAFPMHPGTRICNVRPINIVYESC